MNRRLYRCRHDRRLAGVAAGVAEYFDADPTVVRILWILSIFLGGSGLLLYIAMAIIVPLEPEVGVIAAAPGTGDATGGDPATGPVAAAPDWHAAPSAHRHASRGSGNGSLFVGVVLVLFGALALIDGYVPALADGGRFLWPAFILGIGALLVATALRRQPNES